MFVLTFSFKALRRLILIKKIEKKFSFFIHLRWFIHVKEETEYEGS